MQHRIQWSAQKVGPTAKQVQSALQHTIEYNAIQCNTMECNAAMQEGTAQCEAQYKTPLVGWFGAQKEVKWRLPEKSD